MKKLTYLMAALLSVALVGCSPEESGNQGNNGPEPEPNPGTDQMKPSDVKKALCDVDIWKMEYKDSEFFFQFTEEGKVTSTPGSPLYHKDALTTDYTLDSNGPAEVILGIAGSALKYLGTDAEQRLIVTAFAADKITAKGATGKADMSLAPATAKEWEDCLQARKEATMDVADIKEALCAVDVWKMAYEGTTFFFQFNADGKVTSTPGEPFLLKDPVVSDYDVTKSANAEVVLTITGSGALKYLAANVESVLVISKYTQEEITAAGKTYELPMNLTVATAQEWEAVQKAREEAQEGVLKTDALKGNLSCGVIRDVNNHYLAHYRISGEEFDKITFTYLLERELKHDEYALTITAAPDNKNLMTLAFTEVTFESHSFGKLIFDATVEGEESMSMEGDLKVDNDNASAVDYYLGQNGQSYTPMHKIDFNPVCGYAKQSLMDELKAAEVDEVNFDDRMPRNIVFCPGNWDLFSWVGFGTNASVDNENEPGHVYFKKLNEPWNPVNQSITLGLDYIPGACAQFIAAFFHADGYYMFRDIVGEQQFIYMFSPTTDNWFQWEWRPGV